MAGMHNLDDFIDNNSASEISNVLGELARRSFASMDIEDIKQGKSSDGIKKAIGKMFKDEIKEMLTERHNEKINKLEDDDPQIRSLEKMLEQDLKATDSGLIKFTVPELKQRIMGKIEVVNASSDENKEEQLSALKERYESLHHPILEIYEFSNNFVGNVQSSILNCDDLNKSVRRAEKWLEVEKECFDNKDYFTSSMVKAAFKSMAIERLPIMQGITNLELKTFHDSFTSATDTRNEEASYAVEHTGSFSPMFFALLDYIADPSKGIDFLSKFPHGR